MKTKEIRKTIDREITALEGQLEALRSARDSLNTYQALNGRPVSKGKVKATGKNGVTRVMMECKECGMESDWPASRAEHVRSVHGYKGQDASTTSKYWEKVV